MKRRLAMRWLKAALAGELDDNTSRTARVGQDPRYPDVWFEFSAHTCPPGHRHSEEMKVWGT